MSDTTTPRTDNRIIKMLSSLQSGTQDVVTADFARELAATRDVVTADFARQLERELAASRELLRQSEGAAANPFSLYSEAQHIEQNMGLNAPARRELSKALRKLESAIREQQEQIAQIREANKPLLAKLEALNAQSK